MAENMSNIVPTGTMLVFRETKQSNRNTEQTISFVCLKKLASETSEVCETNERVLKCFVDDEFERSEEEFDSQAQD